MHRDHPAPFLPAGRASQAVLAEQIHRVSNVVSLGYLADFPVALMVLNRERQIVFCNERGMELMGPNAKSPFGQRPGEAFSCVHSRDGEDGCGTGPLCRYCGAARSLAAAMAGLVEAQECAISRSRTEHLDQLDILVWTKPVDVGGEVFYLFAVIDISERKRRESLERIFLHDLMNTAGSLSSLMRLIDPKEATFSEYFSLARDASEQLVDELVSHRMLSDAESGSLPADFAVVSTADLMGSIAEIYRRIAESRGILFSVEQPDATILFTTDPVLLRRVLSNLIKNALEASVRGQEVRIACARKDDRIVFSVSNPTVIPESVLSHLFVRSFSTKAPGRGLGTYAARLFTEDFLRGTIRAETRPGEGTTFTVSLPASLTP